MTSHDVLVVGLGGAGSSAAYHLARAGLRVLGIEQFGPMHSYGSSHGRTRIFRTAYSEGIAYVPLVQRAQQLWYELERVSGEKLIRRTGGLLIGRRDTRIVSGAIHSAEKWALPHEILSPSEAQDRYPQFVLADDEVAVWDPGAGALFPERCIAAHASQAAGAGAELHYGERVKDWSASGEGVRLRTTDHEYRASSLVLTAGAWTASLVPNVALPLRIERQFMLWFPPSSPEIVTPERMPVFLWDRPSAFETYGVPDFGDGVKVGSWQGKVAATPEAADRAFGEPEAAPMRRFVAESMHGVLPQETEHTSCLYTLAPDRNFVLGTHPRNPNVVVVSACSGHGFKFTSVIGEVVARLVQDEPTGFDLASFDPGRFTATFR